LLTDVVLPQMGLEVAEGTVVALHAPVGATVAEGDPLVEVETDKALTDIVAPRDGVVVAYSVEVGDTVPVGATLLRLGDDADDLEPTADAAAPEPVAAPATVAVGNGAAPAAPDNAPARGAQRIRAAPVARRAAAHLGVALEQVAGSGPRGRVTLGDVERAARERSAGEPPAPAPSGERLEPMSATRRAIARRMTESQQIPQFSLEREIDATWLLAEKTRIAAETPVKVGVNDLLLQALAEAVVRTLDLATSFVPAADGGQPQVLRREGVDIGLAVATDRGLLVPVVRRAHERGLGELALERVRLTEAARSGRLDLAEMSGATVSLSSLASFGVDRFTAMLNPGESAILAVGRSVERVVPRERGVAIVPVLSLTLTLDHRVVDGATGAHALAGLADLLEGAMVWRT
jgi:pyruvate dehydrogenase E2 component (dihydrolipoamide acetyltransferase)